MLRYGCVLIVVFALAGSVAMAHDIDGVHEHADKHFPIAETSSGVALILAAGSFWMSLRTRRRLNDYGLLTANT